MYKARLKNFNVETIANSGQVFRFYKNEYLSKGGKHAYDLYAGEKHLFISTHNFLDYDFSCSKKEFDEFYKKYFDLSYNYDKIYKVVKKSDDYLMKCIKYGFGIRILNQDPYEMLISFIISQRKSIPAIRTSVERLCKLCGKKKKDKHCEYYAFPSVTEIMKNKSKLSKCGLGYRVSYIIDACEKVLSGNVKLYNNKNVSLDYLMRIKGVGIKVASCVMLFAYHDFTICPIDVWMKRVLDKNYGGTIPKAYEKYAGVIQQYLFNYAKDENRFKKQ